MFLQGEEHLILDLSKLVEEGRGEEFGRSETFLEKRVGEFWKFLIVFNGLWRRTWTYWGFDTNVITRHRRLSHRPNIIIHYWHLRKIIRLLSLLCLQNLIIEVILLLNKLEPLLSQLQLHRLLLCNFIEHPAELIRAHIQILKEHVIVPHIFF